MTDEPERGRSSTRAHRPGSTPPGGGGASSAEASTWSGEGVTSFGTVLTARNLAIAAAIGLLASFTAVLYHVIDVVGDVSWLALVVLGSLVAATLSARLLTVRAALGVAVVALSTGVGVYLSTIPEIYLTLDTGRRLLREVLGLLTGRSIFQIARADLWVVSITPAPVFLLWYLTLRRRYAMGAWAGGLTLGFFVLTGDADPVTTLLGVTSGLGLLGFGSLDRSGIRTRQLTDLGLALAALVLASRLLRVIPDRPVLAGGGGSGGGTGPGGTGGGRRTMEASLVGSGDQFAVQGGVSLSAGTRFTVTADRPSYWHTGAYDRYTGRQWIRSGESEPYDGPLSVTQGETSAVEQRFEVESAVRTMPAAWQPTRLVDEPTVPVRVSSSGDLQPGGELSTGEAYTVRSEIPEWTIRRLEDAGTDYPSRVRDRYLQLPGSTPSRVARRAAEITSGAETPYDAALAIERWLKRNKDYSLEVDRPSGDVADAFVFEMDRGYCVYFATAMTVMLRSLEVPARFAVGYTVGEQVAPGRWVVRGFDSHAWVEVHFPGVGWIPFDPTPAVPRRDAERRRLSEARSAGEPGVDTEETASNTDPLEPAAIPNSPTNLTALRREPLDAGTTDTTVPDPEASLGGVPRSGEETPSTTSTPAGSAPGLVEERLGSAVDTVARQDRVALAAGVVGVLLGGYRWGFLERGYRTTRLHWQRPTDSPEADVRRAFERLERLLERRSRGRRQGETVRAYLDAVGGDVVDERVRRVVEIHERVHYAGTVSRSDADEAIRATNELVREHSPLRR